MNGSWESLTFSQDGESVSQIGDVVFTWDILSFHGFETLLQFKNISQQTNSRVFSKLRYTYLEWCSWISSGNLVSGGVLIESVENSVEDTWVGAEGSGLFFIKIKLLYFTLFWETYHDLMGSGSAVYPTCFTQHVSFITIII